MNPIDEFDVQTVEGEVVRLHVYQEQLDAASLGSPGTSIPGLKVIRTADGGHVSYEGGDPERFEILSGPLGTPVMATRISPGRRFGC